MLGSMSEAEEPYRSRGYDSAARIGASRTWGWLNEGGGAGVPDMLRSRNSRARTAGNSGRLDPPACPQPIGGS